MKALDVKVGQLIKTDWGLAIVMKFYAPKSVGCVIVATDPKYQPGSPGFITYAQGEWITVQGFDFDKAEIVSESR